jgi:hypothetical protein
MANLPDLTSTLPLDTIISLGFFGASALYIVFTTILYYHWDEYSINDTVTKTTMVLYLFTTLPLIVVLGIVTLIF